VLVEAGYRKHVLAPLVDPPAVRAAFAAGVGNTVSTAVGGALDLKRYTPLAIKARVRMLSDGRFRSESHGDVWNAGPTAVLDGDAFTLVVTSRAVSLYDRSLFLAHGQDPSHFDAVVVKSPHCQERFYKAWASAMVNVDAPGATSANLKSLGHTRCMRPMFPLDADVEFRPQARLFSRANG
jgi:microcystin degradation protein MlrC